MATAFTYNKTEKLKSKKLLDNLFANTKPFVIFPLKVVFQFSTKETNNNIVCGVGVSKRIFNKATDRNRIKRLLRETYRLNKTELHTEVVDKKLSFFLLYIGKKLPINQQELNPKMQEVIAKLIKKYKHEMVS